MLCLIFLVVLRSWINNLCLLTRSKDGSAQAGKGSLPWRWGVALGLRTPRLAIPSVAFMAALWNRAGRYIFAL